MCTFVRQAKSCTRARLPFAPLVPCATLAYARDCNHCPLKPRRTNGKQGRSLGRSVDEVVLERVRAYQHTEPYKKALRKRQVRVEPLFAGSAKTGLVCDASAYGGTGLVNCETLLRAAGHASQETLAKTRLGTPSIPCGGALCPLFSLVWVVDLSFVEVCFFFSDSSFNLSSQQAQVHSVFLMSLFMGFFNSLNDAKGSCAAS
jgi:hypothetical protein